MASDPRDHVTALLSRGEEEPAGADAGVKGAAPGPRAADELLPLVYDELRRLAQAYLRNERGDHTLQATGLVHEAYLRLVHQDRVDWRGRRHFVAVGARMLRRVRGVHARRRGSDKRGADWRRVSLEGAAPVLARALDDAEVLALDRALARLGELDPRQAQVVELRFFTGLDVAAVAELLGVSKRTVEGDWSHARAWLRRELSGGGETTVGTPHPREPA
jgi:RNA polymerase sigma factor (TIGR02999 family)